MRSAECGILRSALHRMGFRFRVRNKNLPGCPDIVLPKHKTAIFVHGCFWHRHPGCKHASMPGTNQTFWREKFSANAARDAMAVSRLSQQGWKVIVVWSCDIERGTLNTIRKTANSILDHQESRHEQTIGDYPFKRAELIALAEKKVRYRIRKRAATTG